MLLNAVTKKVEDYSSMNMERIMNMLMALRGAPPLITPSNYCAHTRRSEITICADEQEGENYGRYGFLVSDLYRMNAE